MVGSDSNISNASTDAQRGSVIAKPQKAFAIAFAVLATALAGCASGLGATTAERSFATVSRVEEGTVVGSAAVADAGHDYMIRLRSGELVSMVQSGKPEIKAGTPVVIQFGEDARVIPQNSSIGYL